MEQDATLKKDYFWNTLGSAVYALSAVVLAFLAMHFAGPEEGGIFGFGFSTFGQQMFIIAYFGIRPFHITDVKREYAYEDYRRLRILTAAAAVAAAASYLLLMRLTGHYQAHKALVIFMLALYKVADGVADLYESECQRSGKLWLGGQELTVRTLLAAGAFAAVLILTGGLLAAVSAAVAVHAGVILFFRGYLRRHVLLQEDAQAPDRSGTPLSPRVKMLFASTVLLFLSVFVDFYIFSASKYAIDLHLTDTDSGVFNVLFMPTSVIYLVANFIIRPYMTRLADIYENGEMPRFRKIVRILSIDILILAGLAVIGTLVVGRYVLMLFELLLGTQYHGVLIAHHWDFVLIIAGGCFYALTNLYYYVLVIMRQQKMIFFNYLLMAVVAFVLTKRAVLGYGLEGASAAYPLYMLLTMFVFISTYHKELRKEREKKDEREHAGF
ncbi:MAG: lipopolysaccharide biosynthesis protein [Lachnospiraceae bacterium]|nr:lipopolysaccharide biosynthesis protein [Lachnospiraceae bacterium]